MIKIENFRTEEFHSGPHIKFSHPQIIKLTYYAHKDNKLGWGHFSTKDEFFLPQIPYIFSGLFVFRSQMTPDPFFLDIPIVEVYRKEYRKYDDTFVYFFEEI